jgi:hemolysin-activating ACP:hemolysin acyltransferase
MVNNSDIIDIIRLYREFPKYNYLSDRDIAISIIPSLSLNQYNIFRYPSTNVAYAFTNWAFLSTDVEKKFLQTGILENLDWDSGTICWHIDTINTAPNKIKEIYKHSVIKISKKLNDDDYINWIRVDIENQKIKRINKMKISTAKIKFNKGK